MPYQLPPYFNRALLAALLDRLDAYVYLKDHEGYYLYVNPKVATLYGRKRAEVVGQRAEDLLPAELVERLRAADRAVAASGERVTQEDTLTAPDGSVRRFLSTRLPMPLPGAPPGVLGFSTDITELLELRETLEAERSFDPLTGLAKRKRFGAGLAVELDLAARDRAPAAVVVIDVDQFKYLNNSLGQAVGDALLIEVAERLRALAGTVRGWGSCGRMFSDQFVFSLRRFASTDALASQVETVRAALASPYVVEGLDQPLNLTVSAGVALFPDDGDDPALLISRAESAMHHAKDLGRNRQQFYAQAIGDAVAKRLAMEHDLRAAVAKMDFELHYQPKLDADGRLHSFEALLRWDRPDHGPVSPAEFIPLAEQTGLINAIGAWVLQQACAQMTAWREQGLGTINVAVNMSPSQLHDDGFADWVDTVRDAHDIADGQLEMEVTESMMMENPEHAFGVLQTLRDGGIRLAIDDFGTGYSSMGQLKHIPVHTLKLDRVFVAQVDSDPRDADICAGMIALAHQLGLAVVAEGVETEAQRDALAQRGCDVFQGWLYAKALSAEAATEFIRRHLAAG